MKIALIVIHIVFLSFLSYRIWKSAKFTLRKFFWPALLLKLVAGVALGLIYANYYHIGDTLNYFSDGGILAAWAKTDFSGYLSFLWSNELSGLGVQLKFSEPRALFFVKFVSLFNLVTGDNYWITASYFSMLSFLGCWELVKKIDAYFPSVTSAGAIAFLFFPSVVFWSSGLIKESLACGALFYLTALFLEAWFSNAIKVKQSLIGLIALWVLIGLKHYYAAIFIPVVITCLVYKFFFRYLVKPKTFATEIFLWAVIFVFPLVIMSFTRPNFYFTRFLDVIVSNNKAYSISSTPEDIVHFNALEPAVGSIAANAPLALISGIFRPTLFEAGNLLQDLAAAENLLLVILFLVAMKNFKRMFRSPHRILIVGLIVYVFILCIFITLSTPNFGTLSRYKVGFIPYFVFFLLCESPALTFIQRSWARLVG
jgi:hypothetical protein